MFTLSPATFHLSDADAGSRRRMLWMAVIAIFLVPGTIWLFVAGASNDGLQATGVVVALCALACILDIASQFREIQLHPRIIGRQSYQIGGQRPLSGRVAIQGSGPAAIFYAWSPPRFRLSLTSHLWVRTAAIQGFTPQVDPIRDFDFFTARLIRITTPGPWLLTLQFELTAAPFAPSRLDLHVIARGHPTTDVTLPPFEELDQIGPHGFPVIPTAKLAPDRPNP